MNSSVNILRAGENLLPLASDSDRRVTRDQMRKSIPQMLRLMFILTL